MSAKIGLMRGLLAVAVMLLASGVTFLAASAQSESEDTPLFLTANNVEHTISVLVPTDWSVAPQTFENARSLIDVAPGASGSPSTQVQIYVEPRLDHADALNQIREAAAVVSDEAKVVTDIGGWPAVRITQLEVRPQPSQGTLYADPEVLRIRVYIAVSDTLFVATGTLPADASPALIQTVVDITSSLNFGSTSDVQELNQDLEFLQTSVNPYQGAAPSSGAADSGGAPANSSTATAEATSGPEEFGAVMGLNTRINANGRGELEIAVSPDGINVVVALQSRRFVSSNDGGGTFPNAATVGAGNGDPSVAYAQSGNFYMAWIDTNCGSNYATFNVGALAVQPFGYDCTGIARSTDNGVSFQTNTVNPAVVCIGRAPLVANDPAGSCFPDQEHIAADPVNAGGGGDQIYSTWRNFNSANQDAGLVCSQDNGVNWTAPITLGANSFFPRITVGQDSFVYVAAYGGGNYRIWKYSSCANGLALQAGWPRTVVARTPYVCPFAGHDRCDQNPSSQTVAVDDTDPNHIYYAFAQDNAADAANGYSTIIVQDSLDGGFTWGGAGRSVTANPVATARRIMPWMCTTGGDAVLTWYEQAAPVPNDSTHHIGAVVGLDAGNNLISREVFTISEVTDNWCDSGWPGGTRIANVEVCAAGTGCASETCPNQPQLAGFCGDGVPATPDSGIPCDFSDEVGAPGFYCPQPFFGSGNNEFCLAGGGSPKYGDYNGNACTGGRLYAAWPSATAPAGVPGPTTATNTGVLYDSVSLQATITVVKTVDSEPDGIFDDDPSGWTFDVIDDGEASQTTGATGELTFGVPSETELIVTETDPPAGDTGLWLVTASCSDDDTSAMVGNGVTNQLFSVTLPDVEVTDVNLFGQQEVTCDFANQRMAGFITGGGHIRTAKGRSGAFISFAGNVGVALDGSLHGQWQTNFQNVGIDNLDGMGFHSTVIESIVFGTNAGEPPNPPDAIFNMASFDMTGRLDGQICMLHVIATDHGEPARGANAGSDSDSIRFQLDCPGINFDYDSFVVEGGDFTQQEVDGLHNLDGGDLQIHPPRE